MYNFVHWIALLAQSLSQGGVECSCPLSERSTKHFYTDKTALYCALLLEQSLYVKCKAYSAKEK